MSTHGIRFLTHALFHAVFLGVILSMGTAAAEPRARDLGIPFPGTPGPLNAITDVAGVEVGYTTLVAGDGKLVVG